MYTVINAAARLTVGRSVTNTSRTPLLANLHWLRIPQSIQYKLCVLVFNCVHGSTPGYLHEVIIPVVNAEPRRRLHSACSADLTIPATRRSSLHGRPRLRRAGPVTRVFGTLCPMHAIRRCSSPDSFKRSLKTHLYIQCYF